MSTLTYLAMVFVLAATAAYAIHLYFADRREARLSSKEQTEKLLCQVELLVSELNELKKRSAAYETRTDAALKTFLASIMDIVKFEEGKVQRTVAKAFTASQR